MKQPAKKLTLAILVIAFLVGLVGCFIKAFDMTKFTQFLEAYRPFWIVMITSIGAGAITDRIQEGKKDAK